jgi:hypothetical protein
VGVDVRQEISSVVVTPRNPSVSVGDTAHLAATAKDAAGTVVAGAAFTWTSSNTAVATVSSDGAVIARSAGSTTITASADGKSASAPVTVAATETVTPPPADAPPPVTNADGSHEPAGMTTIFWSKGTKPGTGGNANFQDNHWVEQVADADAPYGSAVEWRWWNDGAGGDKAGARGMYALGTNPNLGRPAKEIYYRLVVKHNAKWIHHPGGDKLMYFGGTDGTHNAYFPQLRSLPRDVGGINSSYRVGYQNQEKTFGTKRFWWVPSDPVAPLTLGRYHTYEFYMKTQSVPGVADGVLRVWLDGTLVLEDLSVDFLASGTPGFSGFEWYPYWGGSAANKSDYGLAPGDFDWLRYGELYVSGK